MSEPTEHTGEGASSKLRHRKQVQWKLGYVAARGLLQGLGYVGAAFHWPEHLQPGEQLPVVVRLIDAMKARPLWTNTYDRPLTDVSAWRHEAWRLLRAFSCLIPTGPKTPAQMIAAGITPRVALSR